MYVLFNMSPSDKYKVDVAWNNCFRKVFNACWRESVKPLLFYCNTLPASLLVEQRKMIFYNKTLHSTILSCEPCVLCIVMRPKNFHRCIIFFLDTRTILTLKGPFGRVLQGYLKSKLSSLISVFLYILL